MAYPLSSEFRQISYSNGVRPKADLLFRAAVSAFSSLTRPSRREVIQLEDLTDPLYRAVSVEAKRFAAAALSESRYAPAELIRRLADEAVDVGAPLLIRSPVLTDVDLIAFIGRHGVSHARAIRRRPELNPAIARLVDALLDSRPKDGMEITLERLRGMMRPEAPTRFERPPQTREDRRRATYARLLATVFETNGALFATALADALAIPFERASGIAASPHYGELMLAWRALDLAEEQAFLLTAAARPAVFGTRAAVLLFLQRYRETAREQPVGKVESSGKEQTGTLHRPANQAAAMLRLRAS